MLGYPRDAWLTDDELWLQVLHPDDAERMVHADEHARSTLSSLFAEYRMLGRDGHVVWVSEKAAVVRDPSTGTLFWQGVMYDMRNRLYSHLQKMSLRFFTSTRSGEILSRLNNDVGGIQDAVTSSFTTVFSNLIIVATTIVWAGPNTATTLP